MPRRLATKRSVMQVAVVATIAVLSSDCSKNAPPPAAAVEVTTITVTPHPVTFPEDYVAQTEAINAVEIRPRVGGMLETRVSTPRSGSSC